MKTISLMILSLAAGSTAFAQGVMISPLSIDLPGQDLQIDTSGQRITVPVRNSWIAMDFTGVSVDAEFSVNSIDQIGITEPQLPRITEIDLFSRTLFDGHFGTSGTTAVDGSQMSITYRGNTPVEMEIGEYLLATITVDTTGITEGRYDFNLDATYFLPNGSSVSPINLNNTVIGVTAEFTAVPEPTTYVLLSSLGLLGLIIRRRLQ